MVDPLAVMSRRLTFSVSILVVGLVVASCTTFGFQSSRELPSGPITEEQIADLSVSDAYEVLQRLRPTWLRSRGRSSLAHHEDAQPVVYLDSMRYGSVDVLRRINVESIQQIEFLHARDATTRFGSGHSGGAIMVSTGRPS